MRIFSKGINFILSGFLVLGVSCVKDNSPADCTKPNTPKVPSHISVNGGDTVHLSASGVNGALYFWSGPQGFYATTSDPVINNATINNIGSYYVKARVGYCYSDSVAIYVFVKTDSTCNLGDNVGDFPNGGSGPFSLVSSSTVGANNSYQIASESTDSSLKILASFKQKPTQGSSYVLINSPNPGGNEVYYQVTGQQGVFYGKGGMAYVKVINGKINVVVCNVNFPNLGVLSANIVGN